ncbi:MAG TPA: hypothetical protein VJ521_09750, partial [Acidobacteriota bacterium]|nr:hypothetical protein [Acidobacteriota bacterium]
KNLEQAGQHSGLAFTELNSAVELVARGLGAAAQAYQEVIAPTIEYNQQIKQLASISGEGLEATSRFAQVLDDFEISQDDVLTATRTLTKEGFAPNIETLITLSKEYQSLSTAQEKNEFILKNLGRSGLGWAKALEQSEGDLRAMNDAVDENLIVTEASYQASEEYRLALDELNDNIMGLKVSLGNELLPDLVETLNWVNENTDAIIEWGDRLAWVVAFPAKLGHELAGLIRGEEDATDTANDLSDANQDLAGSAEDAEEALKRQQQAVKEVSDALKGTLGAMYSINEELEDFTDAEADRVDKLQGLEEEKVRAVLEGTAEREDLERDLARAKEDLARDLAAIDKDDEDRLRKKNELLVEFARKEEDIRLKLAALTTDSMLEQVKIDDEIAKAKEEAQQASEDFAEAEKKRVYDLIQAGLEKDGINQKEFEFLQNYLVQQGLITKAAGDQAIAERAAAEQVIADYEKQNAVTDE